MNLRWLLLRIQKDYLFAPRHQQYRQILETARLQQYRAVSLREVYSGPEAGTEHRILALRHDVDTSNRQGVRLFLDLEQEVGATATYYFRLKTLGMTDLAHEALACGSEVGYHFEEPATVAKRHRITSCQELKKTENR